MSQTHILGNNGSIICGREQTRGFVEFEDLKSIEFKFPERKTSRIVHSCNFRIGNQCFNLIAGRKVDADCKRVRNVKSALCQDCERRKNA